MIVDVVLQQAVEVKWREGYVLYVRHQESVFSAGLAFVST
jgi:hypothetical protein